MDKIHRLSYLLNITLIVIFMYHSYHYYKTYDDKYMRRLSSRSERDSENQNQLDGWKLPNLILQDLIKTVYNKYIYET